MPPIVSAPPLTSASSAESLTGNRLLEETAVPPSDTETGWVAGRFETETEPMALLPAASPTDHVPD